jgi:DNA-binding transcriptional LysR family regulator
VRLFDRPPRGVTLTDEGRRFHAQVAPLLAGLDQAASEAAGSAASVRGRLRVNADPWFALNRSRASIRGSPATRAREAKIDFQTGIVPADGTLAANRRQRRDRYVAALGQLSG